MDFFELNAFLELSSTLHFTKSAQKVNLSPSAFSRLVNRLETETGVTLCDREGHDVSLTEDGKKFAAFAKNALQNRMN